jgi:hypothetical protein
MKPKEIRKKILEALYEHRADSMGMQTENLSSVLKDIDDKTLHQEISYLEQKNWVKTSGEYMGKQYLNFSFVGITAWGVDLVEDPEEFGKIFSISIDARQNHFSNISGSNIAIDTKYVSQIINDADDETSLLLNDLLKALEKSDKNKIIKILGYIGDKSMDLLVAIVAGGVKL